MPASRPRNVSPRWPRAGTAASRSPTGGASVNTGYKAGNIRDFCERWGGDHEFAVTLDADSFMTAEAILRLVRIMQADPKLGILQGLVVGLPSTSAFARHLPVRHAARHALLHDRQRLVARRLRTLLGP